ncbi:glyoxalase [Sulfurifustis variabilis]|uniref:Glyoxalase n=1 Tax=Sulfurifustis variabilis TaxID=1675686 RepID=A0A1B4V9X5_9GAMM|nr:VOC family protein [Sulfurifustis variabilis]BAU49482.1 glyoxalase [Sulfurifustis variabilis]
MTSPLVWFDIPARDLDRAVAFYAAVLGRPIVKQQFPEVAVAVLPHEEGELTGCLYPSDEPPAVHGPLLYFSCAGRLDDAIGQVEPNGGKVLKGRHAIGPYGFRAVVLDSEGNRIALHSPI